MATHNSSNIVPIRAGVEVGENNAPRVKGPLRVIAGGREDPHMTFLRAYHEAAIARAERDLIEAKFLAAHWLGELGTPNAFWEERGIAFNRMEETVGRLAILPAMDLFQLRQKKDIIGKVWLKAEGERYDVYRNAVAQDAARLGVKA
jgi:hypothetical protein